jgi:hypothetical protein
VSMALVSIPCYNIMLKEGRWATVQWDWEAEEL